MIDFWPEFANEQKWKQNEKTQGQLDFHYADEMAKYWQAKNVSYRGHCLFWGTTGNSVHVPGWFNENPSYQVQNMILKHKNIKIL